MNWLSVSKVWYSLTVRNRVERCLSYSIQGKKWPTMRLIWCLTYTTLHNVILVVAKVCWRNMIHDIPLQHICTGLWTFWTINFLLFHDPFMIFIVVCDDWIRSFTNVKILSIRTFLWIDFFQAWKSNFWNSLMVPGNHMPNLTYIYNINQWINTWLAI